ncbi:hypothetical protein [Pseudomonas aeruginosa]|uniref:hypothetical protein n=1 Tax=Pseudomonas aeruginosa TaxID=287 RepID=UPI003982FCA1
MTAICVIQVDGVEIARGPVSWTFGLFEHITDQPGHAGYDLNGIEKLLGRPYVPTPGQEVEFVSDEGVALASGSVPEPNHHQNATPWPLAEAIAAKAASA